MTAELDPRDLAVDRRLAQLADSFRFLLDLTPVNVEHARKRFLDGDDPDFAYRPLEDDPAVLRAELAEVDAESVRDPTLAHLALAKRRELALQIDMLECRGSPDLLALSIELYGTVSPSLLAEAERVLEHLDATPPPPVDPPSIDAAAFARLAEEELDHYRAVEPDLSVHVEIRPDASGVMVTEGVLLVSPTTFVSPIRAAALLQHEIGTHVLTYVNGCHQPLRLLAAGLAGYEETQEGMALVAEHLVGGLTAPRMRQVAARVVAVDHLVAGRSFREVHDDLVGRGLTRRGAFRVAMRVFRAGGLTKDLVYLRGLLELLEHLREGHAFDALWLGKMPLSALPLVQDLRRRGVLREPLLRPRFLADPAVQRRLADVQQAGSVFDLIER